MVIVRPATLDDDAALVALDEDVWSPVHSPRPADAGPRGTMFDGPRITVESTLVAVDGDEIVGWIGWLQPVPLSTNAHVRQVIGLATASGHQRKGVARQLLDAAAERCLQLGATRLTLRALSTNAPGLALYERCGFREEGRLRGEFIIDGAPVDDVLLALDLTAR